MRYTYEYKLKCVEMYRRGEWPETPEGITPKRFRKYIYEWYVIEENCGPEALKHQGTNKVWTPDEKLELISKVLSGRSIREVALTAGINQGMLYQWVQKYKTMGYNGLVSIKKADHQRSPP